MSVKKERRAKWVEALRSGEYSQTSYRLHDKKGYCCLGVACELYRQETGKGGWIGEDSEPPAVGGPECGLQGHLHGQCTCQEDPDNASIIFYLGPDEHSDMLPEAVSMLPEAVRKWYGLRDSLGGYYRTLRDAVYDGALSTLNDEGASFDKIADIIEAEPEGLVEA